MARFETTVMGTASSCGVVWRVVGGVLWVVGGVLWIVGGVLRVVRGLYVAVLYIQCFDSQAPVFCSGFCRYDADTAQKTAT